MRDPGRPAGEADAGRVHEKKGGYRMSVEYLRQILTEGRNIVCLLGRALAMDGGCDFYREEYAYEIETKYGRSPGEIFSSSFYINRPKAFYQCYREEVLKKRGGPDESNYALKRMEDDGRLIGIITRGFFNHSRMVGCRNVIQLYGNIDANTCPHCGRVYNADYILEHTPLPCCEECGALIYPGIALRGEMLDNQQITRAADLIARAEILLVLGTSLQSNLGELVKYFHGKTLAVVNSREELSDYKADCFCLGNAAQVMGEAYPGHHPLG